MGLAGLRNGDNLQFFDAKKPLAVVYYEVDYNRNPKGKRRTGDRACHPSKTCFC